MALVLKDRVKETTSTTGTGTITLNGAVAGFDSFSVIGSGNTTYYAIVSQTPGEWEVGLGTYTLSGTTLARNTVLASSNGGSLVNFSAGTKDVFVTYPAGTAVTTTDVQTLTNKTISADSNTISGIAASSFVLSDASGNLDGSAAQKAIPSGVVVGTTDAQTLTNKTLTTPVISQISNTGTLTLPTSTDTLVGRATTDTLTNKTISADSNTISGIAASSFVLSNASGNIDGAAAQKAIPSGVVVGTTDTQTLTNKTISGASNTLSNIPNSATTATNANTASAIVARDASGNFSAGTITAALNGNATTATSATSATTATTATNATNVTVTTSSTASAFKVPFANTTVSTTGNYGLLQDSLAEFTYNPSTNTLTVGTVSGALSGNATTATNIAGGGAGQIPYNTGSGATSFLAAGTAGQVLQSNGTSAPSWAAAPGAAGGVFYENSQTVSADYTITTNKNAMSAGDITIASGVSVTVPSGSTWTVV